jgi:hypothetical protein
LSNKFARLKIRKEGLDIAERYLELKGNNGEPIYVLYERPYGVHFWWEYYQRPGVDEPDFEVSFDVTTEVIKSIFKRFGVPEDIDVIDGFTMISDQGNGETLMKEIRDGVFPRTNKFSWMSW